MSESIKGSVKEEKKPPIVGRIRDFFLGATFGVILCTIMVVVLI